MSVPHRRRGLTMPLDTLRKAGKSDYYWIYFQEPGVAEDEFARDAALHDRAHPLYRLGRHAARRQDELVCGPRRRAFSAPRATPVAAAALADRGRHRRVRRRIPAHRISRRAQLVSQHRPQLGAHRTLARRDHHAARAVHRRHARRGDHRLDGPARARRAGKRRAEPAAQDPARRRRSLDPAGAARRR